MNKELSQILNIEYEYAIKAKDEDFADAERAKKTGVMDEYFDKSFVFYLADICWAMGRWEEANRWYKHNAEMLLERRSWNANNIRPDYPINALLDLEATTLIKAGYLSQGLKYLMKAIEYYENTKGSEFRLAALALHAAQIGKIDFEKYLFRYTSAKIHLLAKETLDFKNNANCLSYEIAEAKLIYGNWNLFVEELDKFSLIKENIQPKGEIIFPELLQSALIDVFEGFVCMKKMYENKIKDKNIYLQAVAAFESAMLNFYKFSGQIDSDIYFMSLNIKLCSDLFENKKINPNPFS